MKSQIFMDATVSTAKTIGRDVGVEVRFSGTGAYANDSIINLPAIPFDVQLTETQIKVARGYADHETFHKRYTDMSPEGMRLKATLNKAQDRIANALEDIRIENIGTRQYPGSKEGLTETARVCAVEFGEAGHMDKPEIANDLKKIAALAITWAGRELIGEGSEENRALLAKMKPEHRDLAEKWAKMGLALQDGYKGDGTFDDKLAKKGTIEALELAKLLWDEIVEEDRKDKEEEGGSDGNGDGASGSGESGDSGEGMAGSGDAEGEGGGDGSARVGESDGDGEPREPDTGNAEGDLGDQGGDRDGASSVGGTGDTDIDDESMIEDNMADAVKHTLTGDGTTGGQYNVMSYQFDKVFEGEAAIKGCSKTQALSNYNQVVKDQGLVIQIMKRKMERAIMSEDRMDYSGGFKSGKLDRGALVRAVRGADDVFRQKDDGVDLDTSVMVLVDMSGSMNGRKIDIARMTAIALGSVLERCGVEFEITGFHTHTTSNLQELKRHYAREESRLTFARWDALAHFVFKDKRKPLRACMAQMGSIHSTGANADAESVMWAAQRLLKSQRNRKIMLVLSDGYPSHDTEKQDVIEEKLRDVVDWIGKQKIDVVGIGICSDAVEKFYPKFTVINKPEDLTGTVMDSVAQMLLGRRIGLSNKLLQTRRSVDAKFGRRAA